MAECKKCIHNAVCKTADSCDGYVSGCEHFKEECAGKVVEIDQFAKDINVPTNADRIRAMSDEELAEFVSNCGCPDHARNCIASCTDCIKKWLKQPADMRGEEE